MNTEKIMQHLIGKTYAEIVAALSIEDDQGYCCGWADCEIQDTLKDIQNHESAILHDVVRIDYDSNDIDSDRVVVNFIFNIGNENGLILGYDISAGSGSGWSYGAYCSLKYKDEFVAGASW